MAPRTRNSRGCVSCGEIILRVGKGEDEVRDDLKCHGCWQLLVNTQNERIIELEARVDDNKEEEQDSFKECCDCDGLRAKVGELEKVILKKGIIGGKSLEVLNLEEKIASYEREIGENANNVVELTELRISKARLSSTVDEFGRSLAIKSDLLDKMSLAIDKLKQEKLAFKIQVEEFEKEVGILKEKISGLDKSEDSHVNGVDDYSRRNQWQTKGTSYAAKVKYGDAKKSQGKGEESRYMKNDMIDGRRTRLVDQGRRGEVNDNRTRNSIKSREKIIIVGSSMVRNVGKIVGMKDEGSYLRSIGGAGIKQVMSEAIVAAEAAKDKTVLFIQGGNNSLKCLGADETVRSIVEGVREANSKNKQVWIVILSLIPRPREDGRYERERQRTNEKLKEEIFRLFKEGIKVTFTDIEDSMNVNCFMKDGVHLNYEGNQVVGNIIIDVVKGSQGTSKNRMIRREGKGQH